MAEGRTRHRRTLFGRTACTPGRARARTSEATHTPLARFEIEVAGAVSRYSGTPVDMPRRLETDDVARRQPGRSDICDARAHTGVRQGPTHDAGQAHAVGAHLGYTRRHRDLGVRL